jgi:hypothetical protein
MGISLTFTGATFEKKIMEEEDTQKELGSGDKKRPRRR